jgi:hypothetical protein
VKKSKQIVVTKRDGTLERFSLIKLSNCLANGLRAQSYDPRLGGPLAKAVLMHLQEWQQPQPPTTDYIYRCVRAVLQQTGLTDVADLLADHRRQRRSRRAALRVINPLPGLVVSEPWRKAAIVDTLQARYGLRYAVARFIATQIEARVFGLNYRVVSKTLLAELVQNEVSAWGLAEESGRVAEVTVPPPVATPRPNEERM